MSKYDDALEYIHSVNSLFCNPGLERIESLCHALGEPQKDMKFVHVAGTNGKGSTSAMLSSVLMAAGYKTGLYTSPYVRRFNERIRINGEQISDDKLVELTERIRPIAEKMEDKPTEFELITAIAFLYYKEERCDVVVLECGLGGRLDATNLIDAPLCSLITGISLDHTKILGDTVEAIAAEKAGIIKCGSPVIFGGDSEVAAEVIRNHAEQSGSKFYRTEHSAIKIKRADLDGTKFDYKDYKDVKINLLGLYQPKNAALVLDTVNILRERGLKITDENVYFGLQNAVWSARFEIIKKTPRVIFDGAHNAEGIRAATLSVKHYFGTEKLIAISGVLADKEYERIAEDVAGIAETVFTITPSNPRALSAEDYAAVIRACGTNAIPSPDVATALTRAISLAKETDKAVVILGSLYTYAEVCDFIESTVDDE